MNTARDDLRTPEAGSPLPAPLAGDYHATTMATPAGVWARLYHFLELALAHPAEEGFAYFGSREAEEEFKSALRLLPNRGDDVSQATFAAQAFFEGVRTRSFDELESEHIGLFSANFPTIPCPPYGSLFTVQENKRLEEMLAIKQFYQQSGVDVSNSFDDLPDHVCVELEFLQLLNFRLEDALLADDTALACTLRQTQLAFLDRFFLPFVQQLANIAVHSAPENPYAHLLYAAQRLAENNHHQIETDLALHSPSIEKSRS